MNTFRFKPVSTALALTLAATLSGCGGMATNPTLESVHQPVVSRSNFTFDVTTGPGGLSVPEQRRLAGWFESLGLRYGDRISIDDPLSSGATQAAVEAVAARYGLLVSDDAPLTAGMVNAGTARVVVTRSTATVPGCPDWSSNSDTNLRNGTSANYGCGVNGNLAAMVANPEHLIKGASGTGETVVVSATKAIDSYREAKPTGEKGLTESSTKSGN